MLSHDRQRLFQFIQSAFSNEELTNFCFTYFPQIYDEFSTGMRTSQKVRMLVEHAECGNRLHDLHAALRRENPQAYDNAFPEGDAPGQPEPQQSTIRNPRQIFISHASEDADFAHRLAGDLRAHGWQTWIAPDSIRPGEKWVEAINRGLAESGAVALLLTEESAASTYVRDETNFAIELMRHGEPVRVIPIDLEPLPPAAIPFTWSSLQRIVFRDDYQEGLSALLRELDQEAEAQTPSPSPAKQPERKPIRRAPVPAKREQVPPQKKAGDRAAAESIWSRVWHWLHGLPLLIWAGAVGVLAVALLVIFWPDGDTGPDLTPTQMVVAQATNTEIPTATTTPLDAPVVVNSATPTSVPATQTPSPVPVTETPARTATATPTTDPNVPPPDAELGDTWTRPKDGMVMVYVPPPEAPFVLESGVDAPAEGYWIDKYEVSNAQYQLCVAAEACEQSRYIDSNGYNGDNLPVVGVTWFDADAYSEWVGGALPTEAEWEYTAVGNSGFEYPWGNEFDGTRLNCSENVCDDGYKFAAPVDSYPEGASWVGAFNMAGNVYEWTTSWWDESHDRRVARGGGWLDTQDRMRAASRSAAGPEYHSGYYGGFRVAVHLPPFSITIEAAESIDPPQNAALGETWTRPQDGMVMVYVPPPDAPFKLGSGFDAPTEGYWIDKYEVSNAQYQLCVDTGNCGPSEYANDEDYNVADYPVVGISAHDAEAYSAWVGGTLPTEEQWEYATVGNSGAEYPWGNDFDGTRLNFCDVNCENSWKEEEWNDGYQYSAPIDSYQDGSGWVGAINMAGNVSEWTASESDEKQGWRVLRGGSWNSSRSGVGVTQHQIAYPGGYGNVFGFRVAISNSQSSNFPESANSIELPQNAELGDTWIRPKDGMVMVYVPPPDAPFVLKSGVDAPTEGYWVDKYEVSNAQYQLCVDAGVCEPLYYVDDDRFNGAEYPVKGLLVFDAEVYGAWVGGALPTEAEWEYVAVGDIGFEYPWGNEFDGTRLNFCDVNCENSWREENWDDGYQFAAPVDSFLEGASWVGALNMVGNVWEWTASWWDEDETSRVLRGGSWASSRDFTLVASRGIGGRHGFRLVVRRSVSP